MRMGHRLIGKAGLVQAAGMAREVVVVGMTACLVGMTNFEILPAGAKAGLSRHSDLKDQPSAFAYLSDREQAQDL